MKEPTEEIFNEAVEETIEEWKKKYSSMHLKLGMAKRDAILKRFPYWVDEFGTDMDQLDTLNFVRKQQLASDEPQLGVYFISGCHTTSDRFVVPDFWLPLFIAEVLARVEEKCQ